VRKLARLTSAERADDLAEILLGEAIDARVEPVDGGVELWVVDDADLDEARATLAAWQSAPDDARFVRARQLAAQARARQAAEQRHQRAVSERVDRSRRPIRPGPVTILTLVAATALTLLGIGSIDALPDAIVGLPDPEAVAWAYIDDLRILPGPDGPTVPFLGAIRSGEVWRLVTPSFVHTGGLFHLAFNGYWIWIFGRQIETRRGSLTLAALVLAFGAVSMIAQYAVGWSMIDVPSAARGIAPTFSLGPIYLGGPVAGGLSGTLYGLFGYVWAKSLTDRFSGLGVPSSTVGILIIWLIVCFTGAVGPIANIAHGAGLLAGVLWGGAGHRLHRAL